MPTIEPRERAGVLLHIGYHKTGTTWLQQLLVQNEGEAFITARYPYHPLLEIFVHPVPLAFDPDEARSHFAREIDRARSRGGTLVVSHERLSGHPAGGGFDSKEIAERLAATFPAARVLIGIREQASAIGSMYPQYVEDGGHLSLERFLHPAGASTLLPRFRLEYYEYDRLIAHYQRLFGSDNVLVLPFELLKQSPQDYLDRVTDFYGAPRMAVGSSRKVNPARSPVYVWVKRHVNRCLTRSSLSETAWFDVPYVRTSFVVAAPLFDFCCRPVDGFLRRRQRAKIARAVNGYYGASNARTSALIGFDLRALGYDCSRGASDARVARRASERSLVAFFLRHPRLKSALEWWLAGQRQQR